MSEKKKVSILKDLKKVYLLSGKNAFPYFTYVIINAILDGISLPVMAYFSKYIIDYVISRNDKDLYIALVLVSIQMGTIVLSSIINYFINKRRFLIGMDIKRKMFLHFLELPVTYFEKNHSGDTISRIDGDSSLFLSSLGQVGMVISNFISTAIMLPSILILDVKMGILAVIVGTLSSYINKKFRVPIRKQNEKLRGQIGQVVSLIVENVSGFRVMKTYNLQQYFEKQFIDKQEEIIITRKKNIKYSSFLYSSNNFIFQLNNSTVLIYGTYLIIIGSLTVGALAALRRLGVRIGYLLINTAENFSNAQRAFAGADRVMEFLEQPKEVANYINKGVKCNSYICLKDIHFSYTKDVKVLKGISIDIEKGTKVALVGYSGHGKSTIVKLLLGLYDCEQGLFTFEKKDINQYSKKQFREKVSYVSQDATIFNGTIKENILYGNTKATNEQMVEAAKKAYAHGFISEQVDGYDTVVGERGIKLSGGQRQRIAIARAILKNGEILIMDEATSSIDSQSEEFIKRSLDDFMENRTSIIIAHRLSTVENCDKIYLIEDGKVVEQGTHQKLLALKGKYSRLYYKDFI